ncbi:MAG: hypothetical protein Q7U97_13240, partial [Rhodocyclaceae bacterium]|nr:hypothetical protein [Rhodocyclaceae bacterium]
MIQDAINGSFELLAGVAVLHHCHILHRDRQVKGVSVPAVFFFTAWGFWNVYYYPHLGQMLSFVGGIFVMVANCIYVAMILRTLGRERVMRALRNAASRLVCLFRGHNYPGYEIRMNCLYFCTRCHREMFDRTFA